MDVNVREFRGNLSSYLKTIQKTGETLTVVSRRRPVARLVPISAHDDTNPILPGIRWAMKPPRLTRPVTERPAIEGMSLADWVVENRR